MIRKFGTAIIKADDIQVIGLEYDELDINVTAYYVTIQVIRRVVVNRALETIISEPIKIEITKQEYDTILKKDLELV